MTYAHTVKLKEIKKEAKAASELTKQLTPPEKKPPKIKLLNAVIYATFGLATIGALAFAYFRFYPFPTSDVKQPIPILNLNHEIKPGEKILMQMELDKRTDVKPDVTVYLLCDKGLLFDLTTASKARPQGQTKYTLDLYSVPDMTPVGSDCTFNFTVIYQVNPFRAITKQWQSEPFKVIQ